MNAFLDSRLNYEKMLRPHVFKLERVRELYRRLGKPGATIPTIHCTGTKGKGSTLAMLSTILQKAGYSTGFFHSPHLVHLEERFLINGEPCTTEELDAAIARIQPIAEEMDRDEQAGRTDWGEITWFELVTMAAFLIFEWRCVEVILLEVGMGGRLDATNICTPLVSIITNVSLDHTAQLGNTVEQIAAEKAGILKPGVPLVTGATQPEVLEVIRHRAQELGVEVLFPESISETISGTTSETTSETVLRLPGRHQQTNAALVLTALQVLRKRGFSISKEAIRNGLETAFLPGRLEQVSRHPAVILDVAHNEASMHSTLAWLSETFPTAPKQIVFAVSSDKNWRTMLKNMAVVTEHIFLTRYTTNPRAVSPEDLAAFCREIGLAYTVDTSPIALTLQALAETPSDGVLLVTGSFFLIGEIRDAGLQFLKS